MSNRVAARAPNPMLYAKEPRCAIASEVDNAPPVRGPAPETSRGPPAVADPSLYRCSVSSEPREFAPERCELRVPEAMPTFQYEAVSAPANGSCSYDIARAVDHRGVCVRAAAGDGDGSSESDAGGASASRDEEPPARHFQNFNGGIDYNILEQNISHQSILNQSISLLNRQVSARSVSVNNAPQLARSGDGVVVAVVPSGVEPDLAREITVPLGWKRIVSGTSVVYISPSGCALAAHAQLREYLQTAGTCKCGLRCPLRPETAFSFDHKVASKPYQLPLGGDLTKLCNHKRKLLASLQGAHAPPPTQPAAAAQRKQHEPTRTGMAVEAAMLKKKVKKKAILQSGVSMAQTMSHRDRSQQNWMQQHELSSEMTEGPAMSACRMPVRNNSQSCPPAFNMPPPNMNETVDHMANVQGSHYLTVNPIHPSQRMTPGYQLGNPALKIGQPVLGTNGQIIGVHTGPPKVDGHVRNYVFNQNIQERKPDDRMKPDPNLQNNQSEVADSANNMNMFCGLNQVPPEVVQKIDQQQQIFIQQNQKQIQMAMKGIRAQNPQDISPSKTAFHPRQVSQGQLVIHNGAVLKVNPGKTPPWQVKRTDTSPGPVLTHVIPGPQQSPQHILPVKPEVDLKPKIESEDLNQNGITGGDTYNLLQNFEQNMNKMMQNRVPPLHSNYPNASQQNDSKKKGKQSPVKNKKKINVLEDRSVKIGPAGISDVDDSKPNIGFENNASPSFMDDPSGYLAQQTALLNNTISKQVSSKIHFESRAPQSGAFDTSNNSSQSSGQYGSNPMLQQHGMPIRDLQQKNMQLVNQGVQQQFISTQTPPYQMQNMSNAHVPHGYIHNDDRNKLHNNANFEADQDFSIPMMQDVIPHQNSVPDSSMLTDQKPDVKFFQGFTHSHGTDLHAESQIQYHARHQTYHNNTKANIQAQSTHSSPNHGIDENPVTSSTYIENFNNQGCGNDGRGPIQGGTISTSHVSPPDQASLPDASPTLSNSSRGADTPHSNTFPAPSPVRSNCGTPIPAHFGSPGTPNPSVNAMGSQMINFISNHNVNKNLMEVENISFTGANAIVKGPVLSAPQRNDQKRYVNNTMMMPGYCPPPHLGGGPSHTLAHSNYMQSIITTMASGHTVLRDTITSVLAGKALTATTSMNRATANMGRTLKSPNISNSYAIPPNHPDPFLNSLHLPTSYPLHIAGTVAQNVINKSPLEMVQNVVSNIPVSRHHTSSQSQEIPAQTVTRNTVNSGQILISSTGQIIMPNQNSPMPPPAPKNQLAGPSSSVGTNVSASITQVIPAVGGVQQVMNQPTVLVNTLQAPFVLQPQMVTVDGQVVQQNAVLPQIVTGGLVAQGQSSHESNLAESKSAHMLPRVAMLSPESAKKKGKKRKAQNITNVLHITAPQQNQGVLLHQASPQHHTSQQFSPRGFQLSPNSMSSAPMLQALTIVPSKSGGPAHIVMNGQGVANNFGSQQIITNSSPTQQINLLQPVNLINNASGVVSNFPTFQQFIVPNIGGMVMTADGTTIIQDSSTGMPVQLQLQNVNGQNVLTPIQNSNVITGGNAGVVIRTQNQHGKIIQSQHSPGAQFLSPNSQIMMNSPTFNGQLSPLIANVSPTSVNFTSPHQVRTANMQQQELMQCNQIGQTLMVPLSPKQTPVGNRSGSTFVQQNTTIVQHQTTLVSNSGSNISENIPGSNRLSIDPTVLFSQNHKHRSRSLSIESQSENTLNSPSITQEKFQLQNRRETIERVEHEVKPNIDMNDGFNQLLLPQGGMLDHVRHSVSTQTLASQQRRSPPVPVYSSSPPDTTTHSPLGPLEHVSGSPRVYNARSMSMQGNYADTTTKSPEPGDSNTSAMVQCVSSSEPDLPEREGWLSSPGHAPPPPDPATQHPQLAMLGGQCAGVPRRTFCSVESTDSPYGQTISVTSLNNQHSLTITPTGYSDRALKRKAPFDQYRPDKLVRSNYANRIKDTIEEFKQEAEDAHFMSYENLNDSYEGNATLNNETKSESEEKPEEPTPSGEQKSKHFSIGDVIWGPTKGNPSWPGKLVGQDGSSWVVRWFGEKGTSRLEPRSLLTLTDGLEAHHAARTKCRKSRKLNTLLEKAIQEAMSELDKGTQDGARPKRRVGRPPRTARLARVAPAAPPPPRLRSSR